MNPRRKPNPKFKAGDVVRNSSARVSHAQLGIIEDVSTSLANGYVINWIVPVGYGRFNYFLSDIDKCCTLVSEAERTWYLL